MIESEIPDDPKEATQQRDTELAEEILAEQGTWRDKMFDSTAKAIIATHDLKDSGVIPWIEDAWRYLVNRPVGVIGSLIRQSNSLGIEVVSGRLVAGFTRRENTANTLAIALDVRNIAGYTDLRHQLSPAEMDSVDEIRITQLLVNLDPEVTTSLETAFALLEKTVFKLDIDEQGKSEVAAETATTDGNASVAVPADVEVIEITDISFIEPCITTEVVLDAKARCTTDAAHNWFVVFGGFLLATKLSELRQEISGVMQGNATGFLRQFYDRMDARGIGAAETLDHEKVNDLLGTDIGMVYREALLEAVKLNALVLAQKEGYLLELLEALATPQVENEPAEAALPVIDAADVQRLLATAPDAVTQIWLADNQELYVGKTYQEVLDWFSFLTREKGRVDPKDVEHDLVHSLALFDQAEGPEALAALEATFKL